MLPSLGILMNRHFTVIRHCEAVKEFVYQTKST